MSFYTRLMNSVTDRFGPIGVVIDGLNGGLGVDGSAAKIFNGNRRGHNFSQELAKENEFFAGLQNMAIKLPVTFLSCVGSSIRDNLYFLSISDFFVAPLGAGVAKLRWALDIPGYILVSNVNLVYCGLLNCYGSSLEMDEPFTPLHMNAIADVEDAPLNPPRARPAGLTAVPHPENFYLDEPAVIAQICAAMQESLDAGAKERGKIANTRPS